MFMPRNGNENEADEMQILSDQDETLKHKLSTLDENMGAKTQSLDSLEDETEDFMRGEIDVKEQMDRASNAMARSIRGIQNARSLTDPESELNASFQHTPGGLEEAIMQTDKNLGHIAPSEESMKNSESQNHS